MPDYPRKQWVVATFPIGGANPNQKHYRLPGQHPEYIDELGAIHPSKPKPGIVIPVGVPSEIEICDARHEEVLKWDKRLKFLSAPESKADEPAPPPPVVPDPPVNPDPPPDSAPPSVKGKKR